MTYSLFQKYFCLLFLIILTGKQLTAQNKALFITTYKEGPAVVITVGDYRVIFSEKMSWTYRDVFYKEKMLLVPSGFQQSVIKETNVPKGSDTFLGTGHRKETIEQVQIIVTNKKNKKHIHEVKPGMELPVGQSYTFHKKSKFISEFNGLLYDHESKITISKDGIQEDYHFKATGDDLSKVSLMYVFMHIFPNSTKYWTVGNNEEVTHRGEFLNDKSFSLKKDFRFGLIYDPEQNLGTAIIYPQMYKGHPGGLQNAFWNRETNNKHYLQIDPKRNKDDEFSYSAKIKGFEAKNTIWEAAAKSLLEKEVNKNIKF